MYSLGCNWQLYNIGWGNNLVPNRPMMTQITEHGGVMTRKHFPRYQPLVRETTGHQSIPVTKGQ